MTPRERLSVNRLVNQLADQPPANRDAEAEAELAALLKTRADAPYLLFQRALLLQEALRQSQEEVEELRGRLARTGVVPAPPSPAASMPAATGAGAMIAAAPTLAASTLAAPAAGGFLRNAATIGAGVLGGSLLFQGIESLLHGGGGSFLGGNPGAGARTEVFETTNNYFDAPQGADRAAGFADSAGGNSGFFSSGDDALADSGDLGDDGTDWT